MAGRMDRWMSGWTDLAARTCPFCTVTHNHPHHPGVPCAPGGTCSPRCRGRSSHSPHPGSGHCSGTGGPGSRRSPRCSCSPHSRVHTHTWGRRGARGCPLPSPLRQWVPAPPLVTPFSLPPHYREEQIYPLPYSQKKIREEGAHLGPWLVEMQVESCWQGLSSSEQKLGGC